MLTPIQLSQLFDQFNDLHILVIGDVMVDSYIWGKVDRISPEAPVPVVNITSKENRLGGAANVITNLKAMGANPIICSVIGNDIKGNDFIALLRENQLETGGIIKSNTRVTTTKHRVIGNNVQMLRIDEETTKPLCDTDHMMLLNHIKTYMQQGNINAIIFQDYDKGVINEALIRDVVILAKQLNIPIAVDPKKRNFKHYNKVNLFKPNLKEINEGLDMTLSNTNTVALTKAAHMLHQQQEIDMVMITLSEEGVFISSKTDNQTTTISAHKRDIADVSGAGDTVISVAVLCLALQQPPALIAELANLAGGLVCEKVGVVSIDKEKLFAEAAKVLCVS